MALVVQMVCVLFALWRFVDCSDWVAGLLALILGGLIEVVPLLAGIHRALTGK